MSPTAQNPPMRATIIASTEVEGEREALEAWLARWESRLVHLSEELGCGCCVFMRNVDAPAEAISELPARMLGESEWVRHAS